MLERNDNFPSNRWLDDKSVQLRGVTAIPSLSFLKLLKRNHTGKREIFRDGGNVYPARTEGRNSNKAKNKKKTLFHFPPSPCQQNLRFRQFIVPRHSKRGRSSERWGEGGGERDVIKSFVRLRWQIVFPGEKNRANFPLPFSSYLQIVVFLFYIYIYILL